MHHEDESKRKLGFLWREADQSEDDETHLALLKRSCRGVVRCLQCAERLRILSSAQPDTDERPQKWDVPSDNVAIVNDSDVYKIFDNRFYPTYRKPHHWLEGVQYPWIRDLNVEKLLEFEESGSSSLEEFGKPVDSKKRQHGADVDTKSVPYPRGSMLIIKYPLVKGTHFASKASNFQEIAACIASMHAVGLVHGDIRGFNILHPVEGGIETSRLIDFDLSGKAGIDQ
jgi:hypothetical protein